MITSRLIFLLLIFASSLQAQPIPYVDMCVNSTKKAFGAMNLAEADLWSYKEHNCPPELTSINLIPGIAEVARYSQSNLDAMVKGNVRLSNQILTTTEGHFFKSKLFADARGVALITCLTGVAVPGIVTQQTDIDYFGIISAQLRFLQSKQHEKHYIGSRVHTYEILGTGAQLDELSNSPQRLGMTLSIKGGHTLGNFAMIYNGLTGTPEYDKIVMKNTDRLKGILPLEDFGDKYLDIPIFSFSFDTYFDDGLCGRTKVFLPEEEKVWGGQKHIDEGLTPLGEKVIKRFINNREGRRILIDVTNMSLAGRQWYYDYIRSMRELGDTIPILASHVAISGLNWNAAKYTTADEPKKNTASWFNNYKNSLSKQDISEIFKSSGLIGITLERRKLMHDTKFEKEILKTEEGSAQRRDIEIKLLVAQMCRIIHTIHRREAWDMISFASEFDDLSRPLNFYKTSGDMRTMANDLKKYLENPTDIFDLYTAKDVKNYMYDYTPDEIINKVMSQNATSFIRQHLDRLKAKSTEVANERD